MGKYVYKDQIMAAGESDEILRLLENAGFVLRREGYYTIASRDSERYHLDRQKNKWMYIDRRTGNGGNSIQLAQKVLNLTFPEAVRALLGGATPRPQPRPPALKQPRPQARQDVAIHLPTPSPEDVRHGREYLIGRGLSLVTVQQAEAAGFISYGQKGVIITGRDADGQVRAAMVRSTTSANKYNLSGSDLSYPPILPGTEPQVIIAEGGVTALALWQQHGFCPTVIAVGGVGTQKWLDNPSIQDLLAKAATVEIAGENESNPDKQTNTDALRNKLKSSIEAICPHLSVNIFYPPNGFKDFADLIKGRVFDRGERE